jgi:hypothetical protein
MKLIILSLIVAVTAIFSVNWVRSSGNFASLPAADKYFSEKFGYEIEVPLGFVVDESTPELTAIENGNSRTRINAGCFDSGTQSLQSSLEPVTLNGIPAVKEEYYDAVALRLRRVTLYRPDGKCFALEEVAQTEEEWQELARIRKTFRFVN